MFTFDFESQAIEPRPHYPPAPVGVAYANGKTAARYLGWDHPTGNNAVYMEGRIALAKHWNDELLCHNAAFDIAVATEKMLLPMPLGSQINDTMFLAFLLDPYGELSLKPLAEQHLGIAPEERDAVRDWLYTHKVVRKSVKKWGAYIAQAPGELVAPYACGDVSRTLALYKHLAPIVKQRGMWDAYRRECDLLPMLLDNSKQGVPLDMMRLARDTEQYEVVLQMVDSILRSEWKRDFGCAAPGNLDSGDELAQCLPPSVQRLLPRTPTGKMSTAKDALMEALPKCKCKALLLYRSALEKCLSTYMRPWAEQGAALHCNWNQVRDYSDRGARTGRLSSSPNLQNLTNPEKYEELHEFMRECRIDIRNFPLPNLRSYLVAPPGMVLFSRDYSQQEFRMLAHYEDGPLAQAYRDDPNTDLHTFVQGMVHDVTGLDLGRKPTKTINFGKVYGMGPPALAKKLKIAVDTAYDMTAAYDKALPSVKSLMREVMDVGKRGEFVTTIGGRRYYSPPAVESEFGGVRTAEYKLLNYIMQGGSADQTKKAMVDWWKGRLYAQKDTRFLMTVHDQLVGCAPYDQAVEESEALDAYMVKAFQLDVPTKTDPTYGYNFGEMTTAMPKRKK